MVLEVLTKFRNEFIGASKTALKNNAFGNYARSDAKDIISAATDRPDLKVTVSIGQGNWAEIPWIGIFNPEITTGATNGIYLVYLFSADLKSVYLCQGQGVTAVKKEFGKEQVSELLRRSDLMRTRVPEHKSRCVSGQIDLGGTTSLAKSYGPGVAYYKRYDLENLPSNSALIEDLKHFIYLYDLLVSRGGTDNLDNYNYTAPEEDLTIQEKKQYVRHSRIERESSASAKVKSLLGVICMGCGFDFKRIYGERGKDYIEAHHLIPLYELPEGKPVTMDPAKDFAVLCANCHRIVHRRKPMLSLTELLELKGVKMLRKAFAPKKPQQD